MPDMRLTWCPPRHEARGPQPAHYALRPAGQPPPVSAGDQDGPNRRRHDWPDPLHGRNRHVQMGPAGLCRWSGTSVTRRSAPQQVEPHFAWSGKLCGHLRLSRGRPGRRRHPHERQIRTGVRWFSSRLLPYFAAVRGPGPLGSGFRIMLLTWVELWGFEPQTSCMPYSANTSTAVHLCRSPSQGVRTSPPESRGGCCTFVLCGPGHPHCELSGLTRGLARG